MRLADFKRRASEDRCHLRPIFDQASRALAPLDLIRLAEHLEQIKPCSIIDNGGHRRQVEPPFRLRPKDRRELAVILLTADVEERRVRRLVSLSRSTWWRIRAEHAAGTLKTTAENGSSKRSNVSKRSAPVGWPACSCAERGSTPKPTRSDPGLCLTCGCRFGVGT